MSFYEEYKEIFDGTEPNNPLTFLEYLIEIWELIDEHKIPKEYIEFLIYKYGDDWRFYTYLPQILEEWDDEAPEMGPLTISTECVNEIISDLSERLVLQDAWESLDKIAQLRIKNTWIDIINEKINKI